MLRDAMGMIIRIAISCNRCNAMISSSFDYHGLWTQRVSKYLLVGCGKYCGLLVPRVRESFDEMSMDQMLQRVLHGKMQF